MNWIEFRYTMIVASVWAFGLTIAFAWRVG